jgi:hypothetical protein
LPGSLARGRTLRRGRLSRAGLARAGAFGAVLAWNSLRRASLVWRRRPGSSLTRAYLPCDQRNEREREHKRDCDPPGWRDHLSCSSLVEWIWQRVYHTTAQLAQAHEQCDRLLSISLDGVKECDLLCVTSACSASPRCFATSAPRFTKKEAQILDNPANAIYTSSV